MTQLQVRSACPEDMAAIQQIYAHHVINGTGTFEEEPPDQATMLARYQSVVQAGIPYLVATSGEAIVGFCYAHPYHQRSAYRHTLEDSIYVDAEHRGGGIGRLLLGKLLDNCKQKKLWRQMVAVIGDSDNQASIGLHKSLGYKEAGILRQVGFKFNRCLDIVLMQKDLAESTPINYLSSPLV